MFYDSKSYVLNVKEDALTESPLDSVDSTFLSQNVIGRCHQQVAGSKDEEDDKGGKDGDPGEDGDEDESDTSGSTQLRILSGDSSPDGYCTAFVYFFQGVAQVREKQNATLVLTASRADSPSSKDATVLDHILSDLKGLLSNPSLALSQNPSRYLWNTLFYIANLGSDQFEEIHVADRLLGVFNGSSQMEEDNTQSQTDLVFHVGSSIEDKLLVAMYCNAAITSERAVFYLWTRLKSLSLPTSFKERLKERAEKSIQRIRAHVTGLILEQFSQQVSDVYRVQDTPESDQTMLLLLCDSVVRMVLSNSQAVQNLTELAQHAAKVYRLLKDTFPRYDDLEKSLKVLDDFAHGHTPAGTLESKRETCPACDAPVPFDDETVAMCEYGHTFGRCSLTLQITSWSLFACNGCGLKVSAPSSNHSESWSWMDTVLRASPLCVFCLELRQSIMI
ncbi:hypothetical protein BGW42_006884 [Actinomortierella wolfii]|nr:hypothetical protein BGW42_006884 [Actinomortierella wolfii]